MASAWKSERHRLIRLRIGRRMNAPERSDLGRAIINVMGDEAVVDADGVTAWMKCDDWRSVKMEVRRAS